MALKLAQTLDNGLSAPNAYFKIENVVFNQDSFIISVNIFADQQSRTDGKTRIKYEEYRCPSTDTAAINKFLKGTGADSNDVISRGYHYLKQKVDKFSTALDV